MGCRAYTRAPPPLARARSRARARARAFESWQLVFGLFFGPGRVAWWLGSTLGRSRYF